MKNIKLFLIVALLLVFSPATRVAAYNFAPPIEPIAKQKITAKSVKSTLTQYQTRWKVVQAKPNKTKGDNDETLLVVFSSLFLLGLVGLPLGYSLGLAWLWISSLSVFGIVAFVLLLVLLREWAKFRPNESFGTLGLTLTVGLIIIYILSLAIDMAFVAVIAWLPWFWIVFGALALLLGVVIGYLFYIASLPTAPFKFM
jgi:uncharacterized membrane-anchored protein